MSREVYSILLIIVDAVLSFFFFFFFKQKTAYEIGTGDWSSDVCSSDLASRKKQPRLYMWPIAINEGAYIQ